MSYVHLFFRFFSEPLMLTAGTNIDYSVYISDTIFLKVLAWSYPMPKSVSVSCQLDKAQDFPLRESFTKYNDIAQPVYSQ